MKYLIIIFSIFTLLAQASLKDELYQNVSSTHNPLSYSDARHVMFSDVDNNNGVVCSIYTPSQCQSRSLKNKNFKLNIEHTWPQSKGAKVFPAVSDMHHLYVASKLSNSKRANHPFCNVVGVDWELEETKLGYNEIFEKCFEPLDSHKGNVARAIFYFSIRYKKTLDQDQENTLRFWNQIDPVDSEERNRNRKIENLQGNLNPFIIDSSLIDLISDF